MPDDILLKLITTYNVNIVLQQATREERPLKKLFGEHGVREVSFNSLSFGSDGLTCYPHNVWGLPAFFQGGAGSHEESPRFPW